ncbi:MAG: bifunctional riboflavin kinase/FAD synthetase [Leptospiraceae bacterium]|nr:bifunctional riboflavin kinase/FAD synthetase [Leptospiraceae bacterium]
MKEFQNLNQLSPLLTRGSVVTLGNFDGIHLGHQKLIELVLEKSNILNLPSILITYFPNPSLVLGKANNFKSIYSEKKKKEIVSKFGIDYLLIIEFTNELSQMSATEFLESILINKLKVKHIVIGHNHCFGKAREGDFDFLLKHSNDYGYTVEKIDQVFLGDKKISSSSIRTLISEGKVSDANLILGRNFSYSGKVIEGEKKGRAIGFPTANIELNSELLLPKNGVYACYIYYEEKKYPAMINIGNKPTAGNFSLGLEANILDFDKDIYGTELEVFFVDRIRDERKFSSFDELVLELKKNRNDTIEILQKKSK